MSWERLTHGCGWAIVVAALACVVPDAEKSPNDRCKNLCDNLQTCGMLPSWFGQSTLGKRNKKTKERKEIRDAEDDCFNRCLLSGSFIGDVNTCFDTDTNDERHWCPGALCSEARSCLLDLVPLDAIGWGVVHVEWNEAESAALQDGDPLACPPEDGFNRAGSSDELSGLCERTFGEVVAPASATISLESATTIVELVSGSCAEVVGRKHVEAGVPVGVYRPSLTLRSGGNEHCSKIYDRKTILVSAFDSTIENPKQVGALFTLPAGETVYDAHPCETCTPESGAVDIDGDGLVGCDDPDCDSLCEESLNCTDGLDNDGDEAVDCEDPDCALSITCQASNDTSTETG